MQKFSVADGGTATGQAKDRVGLVAGTTYFAKYWNDNFFNIFNAVENAGYSLIDDDLEQFTKALKGKYDAAYIYNTSGFASQTVSDIVEGSDGLLYEVQSDGTTGDDPVGSVTGDWKTYKPEFIARLEKQVTHNIASDANYTLTEDQNTFGKLIITDSGVVLTTARDIIVSNNERYILFQNDTLQTLTVKTAAGTGIAVIAGTSVWLLCDGTNVEILSQEIGVNQTWQDVSGSRSASVVYTNTTGKPIQVNIWTDAISSATADIAVDGATRAFSDFGSGVIGNSFATVIVPNNSTYEYTGSTILEWHELR